MKRVFQTVAFGLLAVGFAVSAAGVVFAPWYAGLVFAGAAGGCVIGMAELFGYDVG
jgi:hypothetical protein